MVYYSDKLVTDLILKRCKEKRISLRQAAILIGVSKATLSRVENGKMPDVITYAKVCNWIGKSLDEYVKPF